MNTGDSSNHLSDTNALCRIIEYSKPEDILRGCIKNGDLCLLDFLFDEFREMFNNEMALESACEFGQEDIVKYLLKLDTRPDNTHIAICVRKKQLKFLKLFSEKNKRIIGFYTIEDKDLRDNVEIVTFLLEHGARATPDAIRQAAVRGLDYFKIFMENGCEAPNSDDIIRQEVKDYIKSLKR